MSEIRELMKTIKHGDDTVVITTKGEKAIYVVKKTFLDKCPEPEKYGPFDLAKDFNLPTFVHNEKGPAIVRPAMNLEEYWIDGVNLNVKNPELAEKIKHNSQFNDRFDKFVSEES
jgi:hypothetical protein